MRNDGVAEATAVDLQGRGLSPVPVGLPPASVWSNTPNGMRSTQMGTDRVTVRGTVEPAIDKQQVRVDLTRPDRSVEVAIASTDARGRFAATFVLLRKRPGRKGIEPGTYAFQAHVMGATRIAPADSNVVFLAIGKGDQDRAGPRPA